MTPLVHIYSKRIKGFTLIEILVAISIVAMIALVAFVSLNPNKRFATSRDATRWNDINAIRSADELYRTDNGKFLPALDILPSNINYMIGTPGVGCITPRTAGQTCAVSIAQNNCIDITGFMPKYLAFIPVAPQASGGVAWSNAETGYYLYKVPNGSFLVIGACDGEATSDISTAQTVDTQAPSIPAGLLATVVSSSQINLLWTASTDNVGVTGYQVERCQGIGCTTFLQISVPTAPFFNNTGLTASTMYRYRVRAVDGAGNVSGYSTIAEATTPVQALGGAPLRSGQPYAEATKCADPNVIFCEDFNYPADFFCASFIGNNDTRWINPGWAKEVTDYSHCQGRQINPVTNYLAQPAGSPSGGYVWASNWDSTLGTVGTGASQGQLRLPGGNYVNGSAPAQDFYVRFQVYWTPNWVWPGDPKLDKYDYGSNPCIDNKIFFIYPAEGLDSPASASYDAGPFTSCGAYDPTDNARFADALTFRVGSSDDNYKFFPLCAVCSSSPKHYEYGPFQSLTLHNPNDQPIFGKIFRFNTGRWYTLEFHYKLSTSGLQNGTVEGWVDGMKIYSANDLETCTNTAYGDCSGLGALILMAYHNSSDPTSWNGQQVFDNLIISRAYIGPPAP